MGRGAHVASLVYDGGPTVHAVAERAALLFLHENALNTGGVPVAGLDPVRGRALDGRPVARAGQRRRVSDERRHRIDPVRRAGGARTGAQAAGRRQARDGAGRKRPRGVPQVGALFDIEVDHERQPRFTADVAEMDAAIRPDTVLVVGRRRSIRKASSTRSRRSPLSPRRPAPIATSMGAWAGSCCRSPSASAAPSRRGTSGSTGSLDLGRVHKLGYAPKGASVILHREKALRSYQTFVFGRWLGGFYASPNLQGRARAADGRGLGGDAATWASTATGLTAGRSTRPIACGRDRRDRRAAVLGDGGVHVVAMAADPARRADRHVRARRPAAQARGWPRPPGPAGHAARHRQPGQRGDDGRLPRRPGHGRHDRHHDRRPRPPPTRPSSDPSECFGASECVVRGLPAPHTPMPRNTGMGVTDDIAGVGSSVLAGGCATTDQGGRGPAEPARARPAPWFERRTVTIGPGEELAANASSWHDEIVSIEAGSIDVVGADGSIVHLPTGAMLFLDGLVDVALRNAGTEPAVLATMGAEQALEGGTEHVDAAPDEVLGDVAEPEQQRGRPGGAARAVAAHGVDRTRRAAVATTSCSSTRRAGAAPRGSRPRARSPRRPAPLWPRPRRAPAPAGVDRAHVAQVLVEASRLDERGQASWSSPGAPRPESSFSASDRAQVVGTVIHPMRIVGAKVLLTDPIPTPVGRQTLHRADGLAVVAELGVVVVLHHAPPVRAHSTTAWRRRADSTPVGHWCAGVTSTAPAGERDSASTSRPSPSTGTGTGSSPAGAGRSHRARSGPDPRGRCGSPRGGEGRSTTCKPWRNPGTTTWPAPRPRPHRWRYDARTVRSAGRRRPPRRRCRRSTPPRACASAQAQSRRGNARSGTPYSKSTSIRGRRWAGATTRAVSAARRRPPSRSRRGAPGSPPTRAARSTTRDPATRRAARPAPGSTAAARRGQSARPHRVAELALDLLTERLATGAVEGHQQLGTRTGPLDSHRIGPYPGTTSCVGWTP